MIFRILIVDDEAIMRKGLSAFINWESLDCEVADTACDGADAISKLSGGNIDIVITDIRMPQTDGLALSKYIYENYPETAVIILTGFAEFEYARTAIAYNVTQFLLKPTSKDEIVSAVKEAQQRIIKLRKNDSIAKSELAFLKDQFLQELTYCAVTPETAQQLKKFQIDLTQYYIAAFQLDRSYAEISRLKELIIRQKTNSFCFRYNNLILSIYFTDDIHTVIQNCNEIAAILKELYRLKVSIAISMLHHTAQEFQNAVFEAIHTLSLNFYSESCIAVFDKNSIQSEYVSSTESTLTLFEFENALLQRDFSNASSIVSALFIKLQTNFVDSGEVKNICCQIYYIVYRVIAKYHLNLLSEEYIKKIKQSADIFQLENIIEELLNHAKISFTGSAQKYSKYIQDSIEYIKEHLTENISLEAISAHAHVNSSYLSRTFKKECGYSITEYIVSLRIEKAKELLSNNNIRTYEVSEKVGIHDPSYFSVLFKKHTGLSPKEYRSQFIHL